MARRRTDEVFELKKNSNCVNECQQNQQLFNKQTVRALQERQLEWKAHKKEFLCRIFSN